MGNHQGSRGCKILDWPVSSRSNVQVGHADYVVALAATAKGSGGRPGLISGSRDKTIILWDVSSASPLQQLSGHTYQVNGVAQLPSGQVVSVALDGALKIWDGETLESSSQAHDGPILCVCVTEGGEVLTGAAMSGNACCLVVLQAMHAWIELTQCEFTSGILSLSFSLPYIVF
jgi:WD40 repeat protein